MATDTIETVFDLNVYRANLTCGSCPFMAYRREDEPPICDHGKSCWFGSFISESDRACELHGDWDGPDA